MSAELSEERQVMLAEALRLAAGSIYQMGGSYSMAAEALSPMIAGWLAEERERIAVKIERHACDGSTESCDDMKAGAMCPYDDAARIARGDA